MADLVSDLNAFRARTWAGVGTKVGGHLFLVGADTFEGAAFRIDDWPTKSAKHINVSNLRAGPGLGGSIGTSLIFVFNTRTLEELNENQAVDKGNKFKTERDWGINLALPGEKIGVCKCSFQVLKGMTTGADLIKSFDAKRLEALRTLGSMFYSILFDVGGALNTSTTDNKVAVIDLPVEGASWGAEVSVFASWGEVIVGGPLTTASWFDRMVS